MSSLEEEATISFPSIAIVGVVAYLIYRYFFSGSSTSSSAPRNGQRFTAAQVESIAQMFPQLSRRDIAWDLHRNRGSVQATTERVLTRGRLEPAPPSYQPPASLIAPPTTRNTSSDPISSLLGKATSKQEPDLITRYNLQSRISSAKGKEKEVDEATGQSTGWAATKDARQAMLQKRRDEMILAARRKMQEKDEASAVDGPGHGPAGPAV